MSATRTAPRRRRARVQPSTARKPTPLDGLDAAWRRLFPHLPTDIPRITVAAWLANHERLGFDDPCWLAIIAPPSSAKTVLLTALADATGGYVLDTLTPQTLHSGLMLKGKVQNLGLLHCLGQRPNIVIKDLSVILSKRAWDRDEIIGQLRAVYDGEYGRPTGTGADDPSARWKGRATLTIGMTPIIDTYHALNNQLGERFVQLRFEIAEDDVVDVAGQALDNVRSRVNPREELAKAIRTAVSRAESFLTPEALNDDTQVRLQNLVALVTKGRAGVLRDRDGDVLQRPAPEGPGRLMKQLSALACGLAALRGTATLTEEDYKLVERVAFDSLPELRRQVFEALYHRGARTIADFRQHVKMSDPTIRKHLEDLSLLGLAVSHTPAPGLAAGYEPSPLGLRYLNATRRQPLGAKDGEVSVSDGGEDGDV